MSSMIGYDSSSEDNCSVYYSAPESPSGGDAEVVTVLQLEATDSGGQDCSPTISGPFTGNLRGDLKDVLTMDFAFKDNFAFERKLPDAPNPGLQIAPLGLIGLPLSERDAQSIKNILSSSPPDTYGLDDTPLHHTWAIEPANAVTFANPAWSAFVVSVAERACLGLGVPANSRVPKCELNKVLLYEWGSSFLPHQDSKNPGMFATIIIVLPSFHSGGQIRVSYGSKANTFDFSSDGFVTSMISWYADVVHEVKPIRSGYCLALSYNLVQEENSAPIPKVPSINAAHLRLRDVLQNWSKGLYNNPPLLIAYELSREYSRSDLYLGPKAFKGADADLVAALLQVAFAVGLELSFGVLEGCVEEESDSDVSIHYESLRGRQGHVNEPIRENGVGKMAKIPSMIDLRGTQSFGGVGIMLGGEELIPSYPFKYGNAVEKEHGGFMGNAAQRWYRRGVLVLYRKADSHEFFLRARGAPYAVSQLKTRNPPQPTVLDRKFATCVLGHLNQSNVYCWEEPEWLAMLFTLALRWRDSEMWLQVASRLGPRWSLGSVGRTNLNTAWDTFGFHALRPFFRDMVTQSPNLRTQMAILDSVLRFVKTDDDRNEVSTWCEEQRELVLATLKTPQESDLPTLVSVAESKGIVFFGETILSQFSHGQPSFGFLLAFVKALHKRKQSLSSSQPAELMLKQVVQVCLTLAIGQWKVYETPPYLDPPRRSELPKFQDHSASFSRVKEIVSLCFLTEQTGLCEALFLSLIDDDKTSIHRKLTDYFIPLVTVLQQALNSRNIPLNINPFGDFFCYVIEMYLIHVLGPKSKRWRRNLVRKVGCGCSLCKDMDNFLLSAGSEMEFRYKQQDRVHLERRLSRASDFVRFRTTRHGKPHGLTVTKHPDVAAAQAWKQRQKAAQDFLRSFESDATLQLIMGARFVDVHQAVSGRKPYPDPAKPFTSVAPATLDEPPEEQRSKSLQLSKAQSTPDLGECDAERTQEVDQMYTNMAAQGEIPDPSGSAYNGRGNTTGAALGKQAPSPLCGSSSVFESSSVESPSTPSAASSSREPVPRRSALGEIAVGGVA